jgi:uncharacterized protein YjeT (DUF2065 family)
MQTALASYLKPVSDAIAAIYVPAMWALVVLYALLGIVGLLSPQFARSQVEVLHRSGRMRLFGLYLLVIGVLIFSQAGYAQMPMLAQVISVILFLSGGTLIFIPALGLIIVETMLDKGTSFFRVFALVNILVAVGFYYAAQIRPQPPTDVGDGEYVATPDPRDRDRDRDDTEIEIEPPVPPAVPEPVQPVDGPPPPAPAPVPGEPGAAPGQAGVPPPLGDDDELR